MLQFLRGIALVAAFLFLFSLEKAQAQTLGTMTRYCEKLESFWRQYPPTAGEHGARLPNEAYAAICYGYMLAFIDAAQIVDPPNDCSHGFGPNCRSILHICTPPVFLYDQILAVFLAYARNHTAQWHESAAVHLQAAMVAAFPCKN
jgi:Ssp1 endopeptidase immunity protein Rap1a